MNSQTSMLQEFSMNMIRALGLVAILQLFPVATMAQTWPNLPSTPIAVMNVTDPNFVVTLDDSGSMAWAFVPDSLVVNATGTDGRPIVNVYDNNASAARTNVRLLASRYNPLAYNPFTVYPLPYDPATVNAPVPGLLSTSYTQAWNNGFDPSSAGGNVDLSSQYCPTIANDPNSTSSGANQVFATTSGTCGSGTTPKWSAAYFYAFYTDVGPLASGAYGLPSVGQSSTTFTFNTANPVPSNITGPPAIAKCNGPTDTNNPSCYVKVAVTAAHQLNFATWYSFYRTRNLTVVSGANTAFINLNPRYRVTWQSLNTCNSGFFSTNCKGWDGVNHTNKLRPFSDTANKTLFYQWLSRLPASGGTPLRSAMKRAGDFFMTTPLTNINSPLASDPGFTSAPISACRPNFHVVLTDGLWNSDSGLSVGNVDGSGLTFPDGKSLASGQAPYSDTYSDTLADIAMKYWATDLQTGLANNMVPWYSVTHGPKGTPVATDYWLPQNDPATWQHMVNFTIGLGLATYLSGAADPNNGGQYMPNWGTNTFDGDFTGLSSGAINWPQSGTNFPPYNGNDANVADLWHAAINSRGSFFSADEPRAVQRAFAQIISRVNTQQTSMGQIGSTTNRVVNGTTVAMDVQLFPGVNRWYSTLSGYNVNVDGTRSATASWTTDTTFPKDATRNISTWYNGAGKAFAWGSFTSAEQNTYFAPANNGVPTGIGDQNLFNWLLGVSSTETTNNGADGKYRVRPELLGDIVNSDLLITGKDDWGYSFIPDLASSSQTLRNSYSAFVAGKVPMAFVGANDGMLHAFNTQGVEKFAYVPNSVWRNSQPLTNLANLASVDYIHQFYVDGPLAAYDAYIGSSWKTYVTGGLGDGGKSVFILDVTGPTQPGSQAFAPTNVVLDWSNANDADMGYAFSAPVIGRTVHGDWVAIIANGYGGSSCHAVLYIYDLATKAVTSKLDTGSTYGSCASGLYNGLSAPTVIQSVSGAITGVYAGDYRGNVWKFNVSATSGAWSIGDASYSGFPFFTAAGPTGNQQWITSPITVKKHPAGGLMLLFGTGKFFEANDRADTTVQTFYGLRDAGSRISTGRTNLVAQTIASTSILVSPSATGAAKFRSTSNNLVDWTSKNGWYLDFNTTITNTDLGTTGPAGERVVASAVLNFDSVLFNTYIPNANACTGAGSGYLMDLGIFTGGVDPNSPVFDTNGDGKIDATDAGGAGGYLLGSGSLKPPSPILVTVQPKGNPVPSGGGSTTCGGNGQPPCGTPVNAGDPPAGCLQPYVNIDGLCSTPKCLKGYSWVSSGSDGACVKALKQPTWMELN